MMKKAKGSCKSFSKSSNNILIDDSVYNYSIIDEFLDSVDIKYIETYIRRKKLQKINNKNSKL